MDIVMALEVVEILYVLRQIWEMDQIVYIYLTITQPSKLCQETTFQTKRNPLFEKMIEIVPSTVTLSDAVKPIEWKAVDLMINISLSGDASISGLIRNLYTITKPPKSVSYSTTSSAGNSSTGTSSNSSGTGPSIFGSTTYLPFNSKIAAGTASLPFNNVLYPVNDNIFVFPAQSSFDSSSGSIILRSAASTTASVNGNMTAVLYVPTEKEENTSLKIVQQIVTMTSFGTTGAYILYSTDTIKISSTGQVFVELLKLIPRAES
ncbi:hypothetical protein EAE96_002966 [Botrytis aclada]|nr:hypothetical protein EAE96_002966 [Botrytis aclada]